MTHEEMLKIWKTYQSAWFPISDSERRELLAASVSSKVVYSDPTDLCEGVEELIKHIEGSQGKVPGATFRNGKFLSHHDHGFSQWTMFDGDGKEVASGASYARFGQDGKLLQATGFFERPGS